MTKRKPKRLSDQLRGIIRQSDRSRYNICAEADVDPAQLHRFLNDTGRLSTETLDRIALALRLRLTFDE